MDPDPIALLLTHWLANGKPPLAWVIEWSQHGREPLGAAWLASRDPWSMVQLLMHAGHAWRLGRFQMVDGSRLHRARETAVSDPTDQYIVLDEGPRARFLHRDAHGAEEIRRRIAHPPTLAELLAMDARTRR